MRPKFDYGAEVRLLRNVRNDGTFPGMDTGRLLVRRGSVGYVRDVGTYLQDQVVYSVHFLEADRLVGCREEELQAADLPWTRNRFEFRQKVTPRLALGIKGEVIAQPGDQGEIEKVLRDAPEGVAYHVRLGDRTLLVPEAALKAFADEHDSGPAVVAQRSGVGS